MNLEKRQKKFEQKIDIIDKQILNKLYEDGTRTPYDMREKIFKADKKIMSYPGIKNRIEKLRKRGILKIQGNISINEFELKTALVRIEFINYDNSLNFIEKMTKCPSIFLLTKTMGQYHILLGITGRTLEDLNSCINYCVLPDRKIIKSLVIDYISEIIKPQFLPADIFDSNNQNTKCGRNCEVCEVFIKNRCIGCNLFSGI